MKGDAVLESAAAAKALDTLSKEEIKERARWISLEAGTKAGLIAGCISIPGTIAAIKFSPAFRSWTGTSGRVATAFIPILFSWTFAAEMTASRLARPDAYERFKVDEVEEPYLMSIKRTLDENPAKFLIAVGVPTVGGIFLLNSRNSNNHLTFSQKVMHTRVMGQASVLALLSGVAAYHLFTDDHK
mmetsp:Transcript_24014/g.42349  ORF Transcript_24014/g.42349 Transcript_24014/m.42349 type:complete len:186 (-) Transcript_24014:267-824(-)|eukprot:CAMPEP_0184527154 /NCGR_PEP_ID=MMETSP0198_2-20121128/11044_1 /TAXON_ID=1112570 /ORGANISM="Thraustochytrium sp., Strain LLF1b" /LENGTH=185 /DNA_ID=CAMNT_0026918789 /DNA_START=158 /DNA_END=715 /DNA_ORIENTATION=+